VTFSAVAAFAAFASPARATDVTPTFASGSLAASVHFVTVGSTLTITLTNTSGADVGVPADVLTAVFFSCTGCGTLTTVSANTSGPTYVDAAIATVGANGFNGATGLNVGGEWAYAAGIGGGPGGATQGISSSGFNFFGGGNFNGSNLEGPDAVNGLNFGIVPNADNPATGNGGTAGRPLTHNDVTFVLTCSVNCSAATFNNVSVQYGTSLSETNIGGGTGGGSGQTLVPEPTSLLLFGSGLAMTAYRARRKKQQKDS
jgi:hypothetical protein